MHKIETTEIEIIFLPRPLDFMRENYILINEVFKHVHIYVLKSYNLI